MNKHLLLRDCNFKLNQMRNILYIPIVILLAIMTSCDKISSAEEGGETSGSYIFFEPEVVNVLDVKASLIEDKLPDKTGTSFGVFGYCNSKTIFEPNATNTLGVVKVTRGNDGLFSYAPLAMWKNEEDDHTFYAFYPYDNIGSNVHNDSEKGAYITYTQPISVSEMVDFMTAYKSTKQKSNVQLKFQHRLWALDIIISNTQTQGLDNNDNVTQTPTLTIKKVELTVSNFPVSADVYINDGGEGKPIIELTKGDDMAIITKSSTYTINSKVSDGDVLANSGTTSTELYGPLLFLPVSEGIFNYSLKITYLDLRGTECSFSTTGNTLNKAFEAGKRYKLSVKKTNDTFIVGTLTPTDWTDQNVNHEFN